MICTCSRLAFFFLITDQQKFSEKTREEVQNDEDLMRFLCECRLGLNDLSSRVADDPDPILTVADLRHLQAQLALLEKTAQESIGETEGEQEGEEEKARSRRSSLLEKGQHEM
jgi:hypothetical protein